MRKLRRMLVPLLAAGAWVATVQSASAADPVATREADPERRAVELFRESVEHYRAGRFQRAVDLLTEARTLKREPVLLYNLARAYEGIGRLTEAVEAYEQYLQEAPSAQDRGAIIKRIETLQKQLDERARLERDKRRAELERRRLQGQRATKPKEMSAAPWIVASAGGAVLANAAVFGLLSRSNQSDAQREAVAVDAQDALDEAQTYATVANASWATGGALAISGLVWGYFDWKAVHAPVLPDQSARPHVHVAADKVMVSVSF